MTSTFFQRLLIIILLAGTVPTLWAQEYKYEIGGMAGGAFYMGDANKNTIFKGMNPAVGAVFRYNINFRWALKANLMWGQVSGKTEGMENVFPNNAQTSFNRSIMELGGQAEFNFFRICTNEGFFIRTYFLAILTKGENFCDPFLYSNIQIFVFTFR